MATWAWVEARAREMGLPVVCESEAGLVMGVEAAEGDAREVVGLTEVGRLHKVAPLRAADGIPLAMERLGVGAVDDAGLLDALYLHKTEQETLDRQRAARQRGVGAR